MAPSSPVPFVVARQALQTLLKVTVRGGLVVGTLPVDHAGRGSKLNTGGICL